MTFEIGHALDTFTCLLILAGFGLGYVVLMRTWLWIMGRRKK